MGIRKTGIRGMIAAAGLATFVATAGISGTASAATTYHHCHNTLGVSYIVIQGATRGYRNCTNMFFSVKAAIGMACFHISNKTSKWPQLGTIVYGTLFACK